MRIQHLKRMIMPMEKHSIKIALIIFTLLFCAELSWSTSLSPGDIVGWFNFQPTISSDLNHVTYDFDVENTGFGGFGSLNIVVQGNRLSGRSFISRAWSIDSLTEKPLNDYKPTYRTNMNSVKSNLNWIAEAAREAHDSALFASIQLIAETVGIEDALAMAVFSAPAAFTLHMAGITAALLEAYAIQNLSYEMKRLITESRSLQTVTVNAYNNLAYRTLKPTQATLTGWYITDEDPPIFSSLVISDITSPGQAPITVAPEPSTLLLVVFGLVSINGLKRRFSK